MAELPIAPVKRIIKASGAARVSDDAAIELANAIEDFGEGIARVVHSFKNVGMKNVRVRLYPDDRHEILNETDKERVYKDLYRWISYYTP